MLRGPHERALVSFDEFRCSKMLQDYWEAAPLSAAGEESEPEVLVGAGSRSFGRTAARRGPVPVAVVDSDLAAPRPRASVSRGYAAAGRDADGVPPQAVRRRTVDPFAQTAPIPTLVPPRQRRTRPARFGFLKRYFLYLVPVAAILVLIGLGGLLVVPRSAPPKSADKPAGSVETVALPMQPATANAASIPTTVPATPTPLPDRMRVVNSGPAGAWLRPEPNPAVKGTEMKADGAVVDILGQEADVDGQPWRLVRDDRGNVGWIAAKNLGPVTGADQFIGNEALLARAPVTARAGRSTTDSPDPAGATGIGATASIEFWLRSEPNRGARQAALILVGSQITLLDSRAGEIIDRGLSSPAKWYLVRTPQGENGWAYSGWVRRGDGR